MLITEMLARNARMYATDTALVERWPEKGSRVTLTWRQFDEMANRTARALLNRGIVKGDRVVLLLTNNLVWLPIYFGILRTGALAVPLNFRFEADTIERCTRAAGAKAMVFGEEFIDRITAVKHRLDTTVTTFVFAGPAADTPAFAGNFDALTAASSPADPAVPVTITDPAAIYFTSGTTGDPKGVLLTHRNLESACIVENRHHLQTRDDVFLCIPPLYHTGAKMHWFGSLVVGGRTVILKGVKPEWVLEAVSEEGATIVWLLVPWALDILWALESGHIRRADYRLDQWRLMHIGAQPVPPSLVRDWQAQFPGQQYDTNYGLTESTGPGCIHLGVENMDKVGAIGRPGFDWEARIVDGTLNPVAPGEKGELMVRGPGVMTGYWSNPDATRSVLADGWLRTGDVARQDDEGFIWLVDRLKDVIISGGENIYPVEIEDYLQGHPAVMDVAVIGVPDTRLGEIPVAVVSPKPDRALTESDIVDFCRHLPRYKRPRQVFFGQVPRNPTGKIEKPRLRQKYGMPSVRETPGLG